MINKKTGSLEKILQEGFVLIEKDISGFDLYAKDNDRILYDKEFKREFLRYPFKDLDKVPYE